VKTQIAKSGRCIRCAKTTEWTAHEGWVFHAIAKHWRCAVCGCAAEPHLFLDFATMQKLRREEAARLLDRED